MMSPLQKQASACDNIFLTHISFYAASFYDFVWDMKIILASSSPYRRQQLESLGLKFDALRPEFDEEAHKDLGLSPTDLAHKLAYAKGQCLFPRHTGDLVISGDQLVDFKGEVLGKPGNKEVAVEQLLRLSGNTHYLVSALCVFYGDQVLHHTDITRLTMRDLSQEQIVRYVDYEKPFDCAGSYKLERSGISLFSSIESKDQSAIMGIPLIALTDFLLQLKIPLDFL
jgi:septum formation protein